MRVSAILIILIAAGPATAQTISYSPTSFKAWGLTEYTQKAAVAYGMYSLVGLHINVPAQDGVRYTDYLGEPVDHRVFLGAFVSPLRFDIGFLYGSVGAGLFTRPFPNRNGRHAHTKFELGVQPVSLASVSYTHISNVYRGLNPGVDNINLTIHF